jgi:hypothetical protein
VPPWFRKHDLPGVPHVGAPLIAYPTSLRELIELCRDHPPEQRLRAAGSHWALSEAAVADHTFIETNDPTTGRPSMSRTLHDVIPGCMDGSLLRGMAADRSPRSSLVHVEAGKRIYQLYAELDQVDPLSSDVTLAGLMSRTFGNPMYRGPWAFPTLGGAGGQTVVGAVSTGTHGGDFRQAPIVDAVRAIHLVADGGRHYWIEPRELGPLTDDANLIEHFDTPDLGGPGNFELIRDDAVFTAALVSVGRFGVIYSVVLQVVPQYSLYERRRLRTWQDVKKDIKRFRSPLYDPALASPDAEVMPSTEVVGRNRFLQVAICLTPHDNFTKNRVGITQRWELELPPDPQGRAERVGGVTTDPGTGEQHFERAGRSHAYSPPDDPGEAPSPSFLEAACADASFLKGVIETVIDEVTQLVESHGTEVAAGVGAVVAVGGAGLLALLPQLALLLLVLKELLEAFDDDDDRLGQHMEHIKNTLLDPPLGDPLSKAAGLFLWQLMAYEIFGMMQKKRDYEAISYAVMDQHDYLNVSCDVNVDSIEVFFDAAGDELIAFVDALIAYETMQEFRGLAFVGYASLRFTGPTWSLLGMQKYDRTCSVEVACLKDVSGGQELIDYAAGLALNPNLGGFHHWGQHNDYRAADVERLFGDPADPGGGALGTWRDVLRRLTDDGRLDGFSSRFSRRVGLEVGP